MTAHDPTAPIALGRTGLSVTRLALGTAPLSTFFWGNDAETAGQIRALVAKGAMGTGVMTTEDCHKTYEELVAKGVEFTEEPTERFYGTDCGLRDPFGNPLRITQPAPQPLKIPTPEEFAANAE